jgi:hypothetical protein
MGRRVVFVDTREGRLDDTRRDADGLPTTPRRRGPRDYPAVMHTLAPECFLEHVSLGLRSEGRPDAMRAYEELFGAFPDLGSISGGIAFGDDVLVAFGQLHGTMKGPWLGLETRDESSPSRSSTSFRSRTD